MSFDPYQDIAPAKTQQLVQYSFFFNASFSLLNAFSILGTL